MNENRKIFRFLKDHTILYLLIKEPAKIVLDFPKMLKVIDSPSYFPEKERKTRLVRFAENTAWLLKYHEANCFYNLYGLDIKEKADADTYVDYLSFMRSRDRANKTKDCWDNQAVLLRDKHLFYKYMKANGLSVPEVFAVTENGRLFNSEFEEIPIDSLSEQKDYFVKDQKGECGSFVVHVKDFDDFTAKWEQIRQRTCIFQKSIKQSREMDVINSGAINTLRIVTVNKNGKVYVLSAILRVGTQKTGNVDNWAKGGLAVGVRDDGYLKQFGFYKPGYGLKTDVHPDSGVKFSEFKVPQWEEACEAAVRAHRTLHGIGSIGWDIAITDDGPCFIEGNDNWEISLNQGADRGLKKDWLEATGE